MVDFTKLMRITPEQAAEDRRKASEEFTARMQAKVFELTGQIRAIQDSAMRLSAHEQRFIEDMDRKSLRRDFVGLVGGELLHLSDRQMQFLQSLHKRATDFQDQGPAEGRAGSPFAHLARNRGG